MHVYASWQDFPKSEWRWPAFSPQELACRGDGKLAIDPRSLDMLQRLRDRIGRPLIVNSAYRSPDYNAKVGGKPNSFHMRAMAFDIRMDNHDPAEFIAAAEACGFMGIGTYPRQGFVHIDTRPTPARWGNPFPDRKGTPRFAPEPPREPERVRDDPEAVTALAGGGGAIAAAGGVLTGIGALDGPAQVVAVFGLLTVGIALALIFRKRLARIAGAG